jgi:hypothetical protein
VAPDNSTVFRVADLSSVVVNLPDTHALVQLSEAEAPFRTLEFPIALTDAAAIMHAKESTVGIRPSTHELLAEIMNQSHTEIIALRITDRVDGTLHGELDVMSARGRFTVQCRPSDGLTLCLRQTVPAPILINAELFELT